MKKKIISLICLLAICISAFAACKQETPDQGEENETAVNEEIVNEGIYDVEASGKNIIDNKVSDYKILIPAEPSSKVLFAANELQLFLNESTGVELQIVYEGSDSSSGKYISLGPTTLAENSGVKAEYSTLGSDGFIIKTIGDNLYIIGGSEFGTLYGVYGFLENEINYDYFSVDLYTLDKADTLPLNNYDIVDIPDIATRVTNAGFQYNDATVANRMRVRRYDELVIPVNGAIWHNSFSYLPVATYAEEHPEWYSAIGDQLCYTAGGDAESLAEMQDIVIDIMYNAFMEKSSLEKTKIVMAIQDTFTRCTCQACNAIVDKYGTISASLVMFFNKIASELEAKMRESGDWRADEFQIVFYAYNEYAVAPVKKVTDSEGNTVYEAIDSDVEMNKHLCPYYCLWRGMNYSHSIKDDVDNNRLYYDSLCGWSALASGGLHIWGYDTQFSCFIVPYNSFGSIQDLMVNLKENNAVQVVMQSQEMQQSEATGFHNLKYYLQSKLMWDTDRDVEELTDKFFKAAYGSQADAVKEIYMEIRAHTTYVYEADLMEPYANSSNPDGLVCWPRELMTRWLDKMEESIAIMKNNGENSHFLETETVFPLYFIITGYEEYFTDEQMQEYKQLCADRMRASGITHFREGSGAVGTLFQAWGIN